MCVWKDQFPEQPELVCSREFQTQSGVGNGSRILLPVAQYCAFVQPVGQMRAAVLRYELGKLSKKTSVGEKSSLKRE